MLLLIFLYTVVLKKVFSSIGLPKPVLVYSPETSLDQVWERDLFSIFSLMENETYLYPHRFFVTSPESMRGTVGSLNRDGKGNSGLIGSVKQITGEHALYGNPNVPYATFMPSQADIDQHMYDALKNDSLDGYFGGIDFAAINMSLTTAALKYTIQNPVSCSAFKYFPIDGLLQHITDSICNFGFRAYLMNIVNNAFYSKLFGESTFIRTKIMQMPYESSINLAATMQDATPQIIVLILLFPLPMFMYTLVLEKTSRIREMMKLNGMSMKYYWITYYIFHFFIYIFFTCAFVWAFSMILQFKWSFHTNAFVMLVFFLACAVNIIGFAMILAALINNLLLSIVVGYLIALFLPGIVSFVNQYVVERSGYQFIWLLAFPPLPVDYALSRGIIQPCSNYRCPGWHTFTSWNPYTLGVVFMFGNGIVYSLLALYLDAVVPREWGVNKHPLFFLSPLKKLFKRKAKEHQRLIDEDTEENGDSTVLDLELPDKDLTDEEYKVARILRSAENNDFREQLPPIVISNLNKYYGSFQAVKNLSLSIEAGTCFGLLGPNGAGKTTTCNILCGMAKPSSGTALINGYDITTDMDLVHRSLGLAPQYEIIYGDLTVEEHLLFYSRLKGVPRSDEKHHIEVIMQSVSLDGQVDRRKKASELSGGMRRRLSLGMSLCGDPAVVLMDEPTTGLDPTSRRQVWTIIQKQKEQGRCIILTTHSLDEADVLCDRIGIVQTTLKAIGTSHHLKQKFGQSFRLTLNYNPDVPDAVAQVEKFIKENICRSAKSSSQYIGNLNFDLLKEDVKLDISSIFAAIEDFKSQSGNLVQEYNFSQTTLEDVFMSIVAAQSQK